jgi:rubrerythrin
MTVEQAIKESIELEVRVRRVYEDAVKRAKDEVGKRVFRVLADEEKHHVEFLEQQLGEWKKSGRVSPEALRTSVPSKEKIRKAISGLETGMAREDRGIEMEMFRKALAVETQTSAFYRRMVEELPGEARPLFARFLEIEEGHLAIVQAEIDSMNGSGFWFDLQEFSLEQE